MHPHTPLAFATSAGIAITTASVATTDWRLVMANGAITLAGAALAHYFRSRPTKRRKKKLTAGHAGKGGEKE